MSSCYREHGPVEVVGQRRRKVMPSYLMVNQSHPLQDTITALGRDRLVQCLKDRCLRSFLPAAVRPNNLLCSQYNYTQLLWTALNSALIPACAGFILTVQHNVQSIHCAYSHTAHILHYIIFSWRFYPKGLTVILLYAAHISVYSICIVLYLSIIPTLKYCMSLIITYWCLFLTVAVVKLQISPLWV